MRLKFTNVKKEVAERVMMQSFNSHCMSYKGRSLYVCFGTEEDGSDFDIQKEAAFWETKIKENEYTSCKVVD